MILPINSFVLVIFLLSCNPGRCLRQSGSRTRTVSNHLMTATSSSSSILRHSSKLGEIKIKTVDHCTTSEVSLPNYRIDYSWTLKGIYTYFLKSNNFRHSTPPQIGVKGLKFHEDTLPGNWSITLTGQAPLGRGLSVTMTYEPPSNHGEEEIYQLEAAAPQIVEFTGWLFVSTPLREGEPFYVKTTDEAMANTNERGQSEFANDYDPSNSHGTFKRSNYDYAPRRSSRGTAVVQFGWYDQHHFQQQLIRYAHLLGEEERRRKTAGKNEVDTNLTSLDEMSLVFQVNVILHNPPGWAETSSDCSVPNFDTLEEIVVRRLNSERNDPSAS